MEEGFCKNCGTFCPLCENELCTECYDDEIEKINNPSSDEDSIGEFDDNQNVYNQSDIDSQWQSSASQKFYRPPTNISSRIEPYDFLGNSIDCAICMDSISSGQQAATLPCAHIFHANCISHWLNGHELCPICRTHVFASNE